MKSPMCPPGTRTLANVSGRVEIMFRIEDLLSVVMSSSKSLLCCGVQILHRKLGYRR